MNMHRMKAPIVVTSRDRERLTQVIDLFAARRYDVLVEFLRAELGRAAVVAPERVPRDVATMNSRVRYRDDVTGEIYTATIVYPGQEDSVLGRISVLSATGTALIGLAEGKSIAWRTLDGDAKGVTLLKVLFQPEAFGRFDL
jgi:regulator of nucleoside diphosphate kinase